MVVKTEKGKVYFFNQEQDGTYFMLGSRSGKLTTNFVPKIGEPVSFTYLSTILYGGLDNEESVIADLRDPVVSIV